MLLCMNIVKNYLDYCEKYVGNNVTRSFLTDLLRQAVCMALGLGSSINNRNIENYVYPCANYLFNGVDYGGWTNEYKVGVLEGCIQCLDAAIRKECALHVDMSK